VFFSRMGKLFLKTNSRICGFSCSCFKTPDF
jgi:hypothetical protein